MQKGREILIIGAGITGIILAERFASQGRKILIIEKGNHIGGNCYDFKNKDGVLVHKYGPHIFHTDHKEVWDYLSRFTEWIPYEHKVLGFIDGKFVPIPFNLNTLSHFFTEGEAVKLEGKLLNKFGYNKKVPILELRKIKDEDLGFLADFIYKKVFLHYTQKQWGRRPEEMDSLVTARVPIVISHDDRYFQDKYQGIPREGYTKMFEKMLGNKNIKIKLKADYKKIENRIDYDLMLYTGPIDEFFYYKFGRLDYRYLKINFKTLNQEDYQPVSVVNYPDSKYKFTRITEFKRLTQQKHEKTTIGIEYPGNKGFMAWPFLNEENLKKLKKYQAEAKKLKNIYFAGRLGEFKYYDMDDAVKNALNLCCASLEVRQLA